MNHKGLAFLEDENIPEGAIGVFGVYKKELHGYRAIVIMEGLILKGLKPMWKEAPDEIADHDPVGFKYVVVENDYLELLENIRGQISLDENAILDTRSR